MTNIKTKKSVSDFYNQITNQFIQGAKHFYNVGVLVYEATENLDIDEQNELKLKLGFENSQWSKFLTIGKSPICKKLTKLNKMPEAWTTAYFIARQDKNEVDKNLHLINVTTTREQAEIIFKGISKQSNSSSRNVLKNYKSIFNHFQDHFLITAKTYSSDYNTGVYVSAKEIISLYKKLSDVVHQFNEARKQNVLHLSTNNKYWKEFPNEKNVGSKQ